MRAWPVRAVPSPAFPVALLAALLAACGGGGGDSTTPPGGGTPPPPPNPWVIETADAGSADTGLNPSIAVDHLGTVHVSHLDRTNKTFRYARRTASGWTRSSIASAGTSGFTTYGKFSSIAVDGAGVPAVSYHDADVAYVYAKATSAAGTAWTTTALPQHETAWAFMGHSAIAVDPDTGQVHVVTWDMDSHATPWNEALSYWWPGSGVKTVVSAPNYVSGALHHGIDCSIALDPAGRPHLSFTAWNGLADTSAKNYLAWAEAVTSTSWSIHNVEEIGRGGYGNAYEERISALAMDSSGRPHMVYYQSATNRVKYATWTGSAWTIEVVGQPSVYASTSDLIAVAIAVDASDVPHVAYYGIGNHVTYAKRTGANTWSNEAVDASSDTGNGVAIAVGPDGKVHIAYRAEVSLSSRTLKYARR